MDSTWKPSSRPRLPKSPKRTVARGACETVTADLARVIPFPTAEKRVSSRVDAVIRDFRDRGVSLRPLAIVSYCTDAGLTGEEATLIAELVAKRLDVAPCGDGA